jgi:hypothetical protein
MPRIEIDYVPVEPMTVRLIGVEYILNPPKAAFGVALAERAAAMDRDKDGMLMWAEIWQWVERAAGKKQSRAIKARLDDPDDNLDIKHVTELMKRVMAEASKNPTS